MAYQSNHDWKQVVLNVVTKIIVILRIEIDFVIYEEGHKKGRKSALFISLRFDEKVNQQIVNFSLFLLRFLFSIHTILSIMKSADLICRLRKPKSIFIYG